MRNARKPVASGDRLLADGAPDLSGVGALCIVQIHGAERGGRRTPVARLPQVVMVGASYFLSIPLVAPLPGFVAQQNTESSPQALQTCLTSNLPALPTPTASIVLLQPGHRCFSPGTILVTCPLVSFCT